MFIPMFLFALPAAAQTTTIWSATLTVDTGTWQGNNFFGCTNSITFGDCSVALSDVDFTHGGTTFTIYALYWASTNHIDLRFTSASAVEAKTALSEATLHLGSTELRLANSYQHSIVEKILRWDEVANPGWTDGQQVSVSLTIPRAPDPDPGPTNKAPTVKITAASTTIAPGGTVALKATATDSDGTIASYRWGARPVSRSYYSTTTGEFSTTSGAETVWTAPERADRYYVRVRVWDNGGATAHAVVTITVEDVEPVPALPAAGLALLALVLVASGARHRRTRAVPPTEGRKTRSWPE